jgi:hypothetical protein
MTEKCNEIMMKCFNEIEINHGRHALRRYQRLLENNSNALGRELNDQEIQEFKNRFDDEIYSELLSKRGK